MYRLMYLFRRHFVDTPSRCPVVSRLLYSQVIDYKAREKVCVKCVSDSRFPLN